MTCKATVTIQNIKGLHARATSILVGCADSFISEITVQKDNICVSAKSVMGLLMLGAACGDTVEITTCGPDEEKALATVTQLIKNKFGEEN